jgi:hypothetical protein
LCCVVLCCVVLCCVVLCCVVLCCVVLCCFVLCVGLSGQPLWGLDLYRAQRAVKVTAAMFFASLFT